MKDDELYHRLLKFLNGRERNGDLTGDNRYSPEDERFRKILHELDEMSCRFSPPRKEQMWAKIYKQLEVRKRRLRIRRWIGVAAVLLPAMMAVALLHFRTPDQTETKPMTLLSGKPQVQLVLEDGQVIKLQEFEKDSLLIQEAGGIWVDTSSTIVYTPGKKTEKKLVYNVLQVPRSCEYHLVLADGTHVWLNSDSELRYPVDFIGTERRVYLKGEAYFKVAKDAAKPFRVEADELLVEALGTGFNIDAYRDGGRLSTTLAEGSVRVTSALDNRNCILKPGQQALLKDGAMNVRPVKVEEIVAWKEGRFVFSNMTLSDIAYQLERWYDVKIEFQDQQLREYRFTGVMKRYNPLSRLVELIEETADVKFQVIGREVKICRP